ncbi:hypothetical protein Efla_001562 [Eimeria flavescens]
MLKRPSPHSPKPLFSGRGAHLEFGIRGLPVALGRFLLRVPDKYMKQPPASMPTPPPPLEEDALFVFPPPLEAESSSGERGEEETEEPHAFAALWGALRQLNRGEDARRLARLLREQEAEEETQQLTPGEAIDLEMASILNALLPVSAATNKAVWFLQLAKVEAALNTKQTEELENAIEAFRGWVDGLGDMPTSKDVKRKLPLLELQPEEFAKKMSGCFPAIRRAFAAAIPQVTLELNELQQARQRLLDLKDKVMLQMDAYDMRLIRPLDLAIGNATCNVSSIDYMHSILNEMNALLLGYQKRWYVWTKRQWAHRIHKVVSVFLFGSGNQEETQDCVNFESSLPFEPRPSPLPCKRGK